MPPQIPYKDAKRSNDQSDNDRNDRNDRTTETTETETTEPSVASRSPLPGSKDWMGPGQHDIDDDMDMREL